MVVKHRILYFKVQRPRSSLKENLYPPKQTSKLVLLSIITNKTVKNHWKWHYSSTLIINSIWLTVLYHFIGIQILRAKFCVSRYPVTITCIFQHFNISKLNDTIFAKWLCLIKLLIYYSFQWELRFCSACLFNRVICSFVPWYTTLIIKPFYFS